MRPTELAILSAVPLEIESFSGSFPIRGELRIAGKRFTLHQHHGLSLMIGTTGIGKTNAAAVTAAVLTRFGPIEVWLTGCSGAYEKSALDIGDVLVTREWICGDEGVLEKGTRVPSGHIDIPVLTVNGVSLFDRFPIHAFASGRFALESVTPGKYAIDSGNRLTPLQPDSVCGNFFNIAHGPSLTIGMVSGDPQTADERYRYSSALAENMEGSAVAQTCLLFGAPFFECRGISNIAGVRAKSEWKIAEAMKNCNSLIRHMLEGAAR
ncbi:MAG: futalosine hydrolase [Syntrophobacteraceae bacterium]